MIDARPFVATNGPVPVLLFGVTTLRVTWINSRRREAMKFAPAKKIHWKSYLQTSPTSIFSKISSFRIFGFMKPFAWSLITFLFRNGEAWEQDRTKPWWIGVDRSWHFLKLIIFKTTDRPRTPKTHHRRRAIWFSNRPWLGITLRCNHSTSHLD